MKKCTVVPESSKCISCALHFHPSIKATETMWGGEMTCIFAAKEWWPAPDAEDTLKRYNNAPYVSV